MLIIVEVGWGVPGGLLHYFWIFLNILNISTIKTSITLKRSFWKERGAFAFDLSTYLLHFIFACLILFHMPMHTHTSALIYFLIKTNFLDSPVLMRNEAEFYGKSSWWGLIFFPRRITGCFLSELLYPCKHFSWNGDSRPPGPSTPPLGKHCCFLISQQEIGMSRGGLENYQTDLVNGWEHGLEGGIWSEHLGVQRKKYSAIPQPP